MKFLPRLLALMMALQAAHAHAQAVAAPQSEETPQATAPTVPAADAGAQGPGVSLPEARLLSLRDDELKVQLRVLRARQEQYPLRGPVTMVALGCGLGAATAATAFFFWIKSEQMARTHDTRLLGTYRTMGRASAGTSVAFLALGAVGSWLLARRRTERRALDPDIERLKGERENLAHRLQYGASFTRSSTNLSLSMTF